MTGRRRPETGAAGPAKGRVGTHLIGIAASGIVVVAATVALQATMVADLGAQTPTMPSTLRHGSGLIDVPVSSVLPHLQITGTFSGFYSSLGQRVEIGESGRVIGYGPGRSELYTDGALAIGLYDRFEAGVSLQSFGDDASGGNVWGLFGRVELWEPIDQGLGLAVGARWLTSPSFGDGVSYAPGRLGFADRRLRDVYSGDVGGMDTELTFYGVATAFVRGFDGGPVPDNDLSFTVGYGGGMFREGSDLDFYAPGHANGWFAGGALHVGTGASSQLTMMVEHDGFDVNVGAHFDWDGIRVGGYVLATNHDWPDVGHVSEYQEPKLGFAASIAICPTAGGWRCRPRLMERFAPDTVYIPPPPPDTIVVRVGEERPSLEDAGEVSTLCLSTGQNVRVAVTAAGDTLVGEQAIPLSDARPELALAGAYAGGTFWYLDDRPIVFEENQFGKAGETFPVDCGQILRVGVYEGVPVFSTISARRPLSMLFVPVRPGVWQRYERGVGRD